MDYFDVIASFFRDHWEPLLKVIAAAVGLIGLYFAWYRHRDAKQQKRLEAEHARKAGGSDDLFVLRGGSFYVESSSARSSFRRWSYPNFRNMTIGFRVVASPFRL